MRVVILGCGRIGAKVADLLDSEGHEITIIDPDPESFRRLSPTYRGRAVVGVGIDEELLRRIGLDQSDAFIALTEGDNTNVMAAQIAKHYFGVPHVISQIKDPIRGEAYQGLGITTICPTTIGADAIRDEIEGKPAEGSKPSTGR